MNLYDLVKRRDAHFVQIEGEAAPLSLKLMPTRRAVRFEPGAVLTIKNVQDFSCMQTLPGSPGWRLHALGAGRAQGRISARVQGGSEAPELLSDSVGEVVQRTPEVWLDWPADFNPCRPYDLHIEAEDASAAICVGPQLDMRQPLFSLYRGRGLEVGPGRFPSVLPSAVCDVGYIELAPLAPEQAAGLPEGVFERYSFGGAEELEQVEDASLDFIFGNPVLEHLVNPLQVLQNWLRKLKPGAAVLGVGPDPRFSFDARQPLMRLEDALADHRAGGHALLGSHYERWVRYTFPAHDAAKLQARRYSVHVNFYAPDEFARMCAWLKDEGQASKWQVRTAQNNRDYAFLIWRAA